VNCRAWIGNSAIVTCSYKLCVSAQWIKLLQTPPIVTHTRDVIPLRFLELTFIWVAIISVTTSFMKRDLSWRVNTELFKNCLILSETRRLITAIKRAHIWSLSCVSNLHPHIHLQLSFWHYPHSAGRIATGYELNSRGVGFRVPSPRRADLLWDPPNLLPMENWGSFPEGKAAGVWSWPLFSKLVPRWRIRGSIQPVFHTSSWRSLLVSTGTTLPYQLYLPSKPRSSKWSFTHFT
jgi:hypothetical protein